MTKKEIKDLFNIIAIHGVKRVATIVQNYQLTEPSLIENKLIDWKIQSTKAKEKNDELYNYYNEVLGNYFDYNKDLNLTIKL